MMMMVISLFDAGVSGFLLGFKGFLGFVLGKRKSGGRQKAYGPREVIQRGESRDLFISSGLV